MSEQPRQERRPPSTRRPRKKAGMKFPWALLVWGIILISLALAGNWYRVKFWDPEVTGEFETFVVEETATVSRMGDRSLVLVYPEWDASGYVTEERQIASRDRSGEDLLNLMRQLCAGPKISGSVSPFPKGTKAKAAFFDPVTEAVVLDFSQELVTGHPGGSAAEAATLTCILRTVALNFPDTRSCTILVDGSQVETLGGHLNMERAFDPRRWL